MQTTRMLLITRSNTRLAAVRTGEFRPSPMARSLGRTSAMGMRRSTRSANLCAGRTVTPDSRRRMNSSMGMRERRSSAAITTVSTRRSRTAPVSVRAVTAMAGFGCVGSGTTAARGFSSGGRRAATFASAIGPLICDGAPPGPTMSCDAGSTSAVAPSATSPPRTSPCSTSDPAAAITSPPPAAICCGWERSTVGSSLPAISYSPYASLRTMRSISAARCPAPITSTRLWPRSSRRATRAARASKTPTLATPMVSINAPRGRAPPPSSPKIAAASAAKPSALRTLAPRVRSLRITCGS